jgi:hypothetical protein
MSQVQLYKYYRCALVTMLQNCALRTRIFTASRSVFLLGPDQKCEEAVVMSRNQPHFQLQWNHQFMREPTRMKGRLQGFLCCPEMITCGHHMWNSFGFLLCNYRGANRNFFRCQNNDFEPAEFGVSEHQPVRHAGRKMPPKSTTAII